MIHLHESGPYSLYRLTDPMGEKYIGTAENPEERWGNGKGYSHNPELTAAITTYGWENFKKEIICSNMSRRHSWFRERLTVCQEHTLWPNGYNLNSGGKQGFSVSQITRERMSAAHKKAVAQLNPETGEILNVWSSAKEAGEALKIPACDISLVIHEKRKTAGGFGWKLSDDTTAAGKPAAFLIESEGEQA